MNHMSEEQLISFRDGERSDRERISMHLASCPECRARYAVAVARDAAKTPERKAREAAGAARRHPRLTGHFLEHAVDS